MKEELIKFVKFNAVGILNTAIDFVAFTVLVRLGLNEYLSQVISYTLGVANSYVWNSRWTFREKGVTAKRIVLFILVNLVSLGVSTGVIALCREWLNLGEILSKLISLPFSIGVNFLGNRFLVFR